MKLDKIFESVAKKTISKDGFKIAFVRDVEELSRIVNENEFVLNHFNDATADAFGQENNDQGQDGVRDHVLNVDSIAVCYNESTVLGFTSIREISEHDIFYVHGIAVRSMMQGTGAGSLMIRGLLSEKKKFNFLSLTTQSPVMYHLARKYCQDIFPSPNHQYIPDVFHKIGIDLMKQRNGNFDPERFISKNLYSKSLYGNGIPMSKDKELNLWFEKSLDISNRISNDGFLFFGRIK